MRSLILLFLAASSMGFSACRRYAPVERHFLRVPAAYGAELSGIDREKWLKRARKLPGAVEMAKTENFVKLPLEALPEGVTAPAAGEVKFFPNEEGGRQGMVALHWEKPSGSPDAGGRRLWLLKTEGGRYVPQPLTRWLPAGGGVRRYDLNVEPGAITEYKRTISPAGPVWRRSATLRWRGGQWVVD